MFHSGHPGDSHSSNQNSLKGEGGSRAFPHCFCLFVFFGHHPPHLLPGQHWHGVLSRLFGHIAIMIDRSSKTLGMEMSIWACIRNGYFVHFAFWFLFLFWETDLIKQVRFIISVKPYWAITFYESNSSSWMRIWFWNLSQGTSFLFICFSVWSH